MLLTVAPSPLGHGPLPDSGRERIPDALESGAFDDAELALQRRSSRRASADSAAMLTKGVVARGVVRASRAARTSRPESPASDPHRDPLKVQRKTTPSAFVDRLMDDNLAARTTDATDTEVRGKRSRGRSQASLYNGRDRIRALTGRRRTKPTSTATADRSSLNPADATLI